ncbi:MAG: DUF2383 domain-containing protein [Gemmataceae bacterium]
MVTRTETTNTLNSLLRGEISAVETYQQAEEKFNGESEADSLRTLRREHEQAAQQLRQHINIKGGDASDGSGTWGTFAQLVEGGAKLFGKTAALKALKEGEEHGINSYDSALSDDGLPIECQRLIRDSLLPRCRDHVQTLKRLMAQQ